MVYPQESYFFRDFSAWETLDKESTPALQLILTDGISTSSES